MIAERLRPRTRADDREGLDRPTISTSWRPRPSSTSAWRPSRSGLGFALSLGLSILAVRRRRLRSPILTLRGILYTIPSLALFAALVPVTGLSLLTAEVPLVLYTLVIFVRNIVAGLDCVSPDVLEAADGMGYPAARASPGRAAARGPTDRGRHAPRQRLDDRARDGLRHPGRPFRRARLLHLRGLSAQLPDRDPFGAEPSIVLASSSTWPRRGDRRLTPWSPAPASSAPEGPARPAREPRRRATSPGLPTRATGRAPTAIPRAPRALALSGCPAIAIPTTLPAGLWIGHTGAAPSLAVNLANSGGPSRRSPVIGIALPFTAALDPQLGFKVYPTLVAMVVLAIPPILVNA